MAEVYKGVGTQMARLAGKHGVMDEAAGKIAAKATANAAQYRDTGEYSTNFKTKRTPGVNGVSDRLVYNDHPAAVAIEYGHIAPSKRGASQFVPGQFNLRRAVE